MIVLLLYSVSKERLKEVAASSFQTFSVIQ